LSIKVVIDLAGSPHVVLKHEEALELLRCLGETAGTSKDLEESIRIIKSFDEFYKILKRKFEEYITPPKDHREVVMGKSIVHKIKLVMKNSDKYVELVLDRRMNIEYLKLCLTRLGFSEVVTVREGL